MYLKFYANHSKGVQVVETINLQCNSLSQIHSSVYIHGISSDTNLAEIHEEMSELLDKQVNVQKESLKKLPGFTQAPTSPQKCVMKMKERKTAAA